MVASSTDFTLAITLSSLQVDGYKTRLDGSVNIQTDSVRCLNTATSSRASSQSIKPSPRGPQLPANCTPHVLRPEILPTFRDQVLPIQRNEH
ncbi:hypothetical protein M3J09_000369 [Ascochyta lentis]